MVTVFSESNSNFYQSIFQYRNVSASERFMSYPWRIFFPDTYQFWQYVHRMSVSGSSTADSYSARVVNGAEDGWIAGSNNHHFFTRLANIGRASSSPSDPLVVCSLWWALSRSVSTFELQKVRLYHFIWLSFGSPHSSPWTDSVYVCSWTARKLVGFQALNSFFTFLIRFSLHGGRSWDTVARKEYSFAIKKKLVVMARRSWFVMICLWFERLAFSFSGFWAGP